METAELLKRVRKIEIKTRGLSQQIFAGQYHSAFKGRGMAFSEVREYRYGDDIRSIDWNVTARYDKTHVKVFEEERELTLMLLIDVSGSGQFGSTTLKRQTATEIAAVLAFAAMHNNDKIGVILFSDRINKFIPPKKGRKHILRIISELLHFEPTGSGTDVAQALQYLTNTTKKRCTAFVISDFIDNTPDTQTPRFADALTIASSKHDLVGIRVYDQRETQMPPVGLVKFKDAESGQYQWVDTSSAAVRAAYARWWATTTERLKATFTRAHVDWTAVSTNEDYVKPLMLLFKRRA